MKKIFEFNIDNTIDIITNSSSELFVLKGETKKIVEEMIRSVYDNFEREYDFVSLEEASTDQLDTYIDVVLREYNDDEFSLCRKLNIRPDVLYKNFGSYGITDNWIGDYSDQGKKVLVDFLPKGTYLLLSKSDNPDYEYQEKLQGIASRYHMG